MTDGESFYLVLTLFYLMECVKFASPGSEALISRFGALGAASLRSPFMTAWGVKKAVFLAPILPWPSMMYLVSGYNPTKRPKKFITRISSIRHHHRFLKKSTQRLRALAILNLLNFFAFIPLLYVRTYNEWFILIGLAYCYATLLGTAIHYHALHKRLLPSYQADRLKTTLYTALLPWHAPRCADELYLKTSLSWSPLALLAANIGNKQVLSKLQRHWRAAHFQPNAPYSKESLLEVLTQISIDPKSWLDAPKSLSSPQYCPCCHNGYEKQATHCSDCNGVALKKV